MSNNEVRSVRMPQELYDMGKKRAEKEGVTPSYVFYMLYQGYACGLIDLPTVTYSVVEPIHIEVEA